MQTNNSPSFQQLLKTFENPVSREIKENSNINDTASETQQENLRLAKEYINIAILSKPKTTNNSIKNSSSFKDQALALGIRVKVIKDITR